MNEIEQNRIALLLDAEDEFECDVDLDDDVADPNFEIFNEYFNKSEKVVMKKKTEKNVVIFILVEIMQLSRKKNALIIQIYQKAVSIVMSPWMMWSILFLFAHSGTA